MSTDAQRESQMELDCDGEEMFGREVLRLADLPQITKYDEVALEYSIRVDPDCVSGIIIYGRFDRGWVANPWSCRPIIRELLTRLGISLD